MLDKYNRQLAAAVRWAKGQGIELSGLDSLERFFQRMSLDPAVRKVLKEEGQTRGRKQRPFRVDPVEVALRHRLKSMRHVLYFPPRRGCSPDFMFCSAAT
ncbi:MAG: hypothetical protein IPJ33_05420 [Gammaproteobacteria bacterium]|nr:hypothetical protein [Gammaproteobacteria bacterium]MBP6050863.1 hypothetical protein [Pseudomonadales bacterium]MBK6584350.1 hypothetical protein [Gammaproteobacteria bacterium]MBK7168409.1 hypothetical protein [Gammaproteobacteria bacterium]MBK7520810.1 hypothetical protein [Gammaproteobacteria bacterium]